MAKKRTIKKKSFKSKRNYVPKIVVIILFSLIISLVTYILLVTKFKEDIPLEEKTPALNIIYKQEPVKNIEKKKVDIKKEYNKIIKEKTTTKTKKTVVKKDTRPKLAIIIDDVSFKIQVDKIQDIGYPITMAFLPPTSRHKNSAKIANNIPFYMIHFPLEAQTFKFAEDKTLKINDSYQTMLQRVQELHILYPKATYTNNHTGSKFTSNTKAMNNLMKALKKYDFTFVDSRTTAKSVAKKTAFDHNVPFLTRNIFLDNKQDKSYIQGQLMKAINIAKKEGSAIAICHPRNITLKTLKESKHLLKDVQMVLINQL
ncbi:MAG: divergent polysaccharide deacetylase family protein [Campylobacteraceae bacterium]|jgi:hypothetical protein|nr:divergent polysaccharide deacetylase family protein [Campylobacteraceae bacterium]MBT7118235.1 divergent polysaccharide deacetylase family protein [Campylobacteraceae bacterium]